MGRFTRWLRDYYDGAITIVVVVVALVLSLLHLPGFDQALLVAVGLLALAVMRHQAREVRAEPQPRGVSVLNREEIRSEHEQAHRITNIWMFKGGTGTYLRAVTLPQCIHYSSRERRPLRVQAEIIDPTNQVLCEYYASLLHSRPDGIGDPWTARRTRNEAYATVLAAGWYQQRFPILSIEVALSTTVPTFRWDLSSTCVLITQEDFAPHLMFKPPSPHYNFCTRELDSSFRQARRVPLELARTAHLSEDPTVHETRHLFEVLGMPLSDSVPEDDVAQIVRRALHARNPYP